jgi:hypothetical protein
MAARSFTPEERTQLNMKLERIYVLIAKLADPNDNTRKITAGKLGNALSDAGLDFHDVVACAKENLARIATGEERKSWLNDSDKKLFQAKLAEAKEAGRAEGRREAASTTHSDDDFSSTDGSTDWRAVARYVHRERNRLPLRNRDQRNFRFIDNMVTLASSPFTTLSSPRANWLYDLFGKLGGKIT